MNDWCGKLNSCVLFDVLRRNADKLKATLQAKSILAVNDGKLYVWDAYSAALLATNLKSFRSQSACRRSVYQVSCLPVTFRKPANTRPAVWLGLGLGLV